MAIIKTLVKKVSIPPEKKTKQKEYLSDGKLPIVDQGRGLIGGYTNDENKQLKCDLPVIVFGDHTCAVKYVNFPFGAGADGIKVLQPNDSIDSKYLYYGLQYLVFCLNDRGYGRHYQHIEKLDLPVPTFTEQKRIVARIEELFSNLDSAVETLQKTKQQLEVYRQAVYGEAYSTLNDLQNITDFFEISGGLTKNSNRSSLPIVMPYLRVANVYYNYLDLTEIKQIGVKNSEIKEKLLKTNDLLFVEGNGSKSQIGRVAIWNGNISPCLHQNHIIKGRPNGKMLSKYALFYLISRFGREQILKVASSTSGLYTLSTGKICNLKIPYCSIENQTTIINSIEEKVSICESIEQLVELTLQQAEAMRQSILKQAFEGGIN